jgi:uncharacterized protein YfaS (alpha-2-macroglobulin family)
MRRLMQILVVLAILPWPACDRDEGTSPDVEGPPTAPLPASSVGSFSVHAAGPFLAGEEPVLSVRAEKAGEVELGLYRAEDAVSLVAAFDDLSHPAVTDTPLHDALTRARVDAAGGRAAGALGDIPDGAPTLSLVWTRTESLAPGAGTLGLGAVKPGLHLLEVRAGTRAAYVPIVVGNLSLVVKRAGVETLVWVVRATDGWPEPNARVTFLGPDLSPRTLEVTQDGVARTTTGDVEDLRIVAVVDAHVAVAAPAHLPAARRDSLVYMTTDRPLYRAGEMVHVRGIARRARGSRLVPFGRVEALSLIPPRGEPIPADGPSPTLTRFGTFSGGIALDPGAPTGTWRVVATIDGRRYGAEFRVEAFRRPEAEVLVRAEPALVLQGESIRFRVSANSYAGGAVAGADVTWSVHRTTRARPAWRSPEAETFVTASERRASKPVEVLRGEGTLDDDGLIEIVVPTEKRDDDFVYVLTAHVRDESGLEARGSGSAPAVRSFVTIDLRTDRESYEVGDTVAVTIRVRDRAGRPAVAPVRLMAGDDSHDLRADENGLARFSMTAARPGSLRFDAVALDPREREARADKTV